MPRRGLRLEQYCVFNPLHPTVKRRDENEAPSHEEPPPKRRCSTRRRVRFAPGETVIGRADDMDRTATPAELFDCDVCGSRLRAGLRGFDLYAHCASCGFDACLACCDNALAATNRSQAPRCRHHSSCTLVLVDRNRDDDEPAAPDACTTTTCRTSSRPSATTTTAKKKKTRRSRKKTPRTEAAVPSSSSKRRR